MPKSKKIAIVQSNYIPWKGYFDMIGLVDEFILFDDMQYTRRDWRNRNKIKTPQGLSWLTVPVLVKGKYFQKIRETRIDGRKWVEQHWKTLTRCYGKTEHAEEILALIEPCYQKQEFEYLSDLNEWLIQQICNYLGIDTKISHSWDYDVQDGKTSRLVSLCTQAGATDYISGPAARDYIEPELFEEAGITLHWMDYSDYPSYPQQWGAFEHGVTILDLLFNCGPNSPHYMKYGH